MEQEACEKLNRALSRKTRTYSDNVFCIGDDVYYFRENSSYWHGPAKAALKRKWNWGNPPASFFSDP